MANIEKMKQMAAAAAEAGDFATANELAAEAAAFEAEDAHYDELAEAAELERISKACGRLAA